MAVSAGARLCVIRMRELLRGGGGAAPGVPRRSGKPILALASGRSRPQPVPFEIPTRAIGRGARDDGLLPMWPWGRGPGPAGVIARRAQAMTCGVRVQGLHGARACALCFPGQSSSTGFSFSSPSERAQFCRTTEEYRFGESSLAS